MGSLACSWAVQGESESRGESSAGTVVLMPECLEIRGAGLVIISTLEAEDWPAPAFIRSRLRRL